VPVDVGDEPESLFVVTVFDKLGVPGVHERIGP
jgi:hypothetical protein